MNFFNYIIQFGASVMMPIIFTIIGLCIGMKFGKALKSGLYVGVGFVGLGIVTALLTDNFKDPLQAIENIFSLNLSVFDMGWPAAASVAYNTAVGALIIPVCLGINFLMVLTKTTRTVNIDLWNYWHFAFIGAVAYFVFGQSLLWGYFAAIVCYIITLVMADLTAGRFQKYYNLPGISVPQPFCQSVTPFAVAISWLLDKIPGFDRLNIDAEGMKKKFGVLGEPLVLGVIVGALIATAAHIGDFRDFSAFMAKLPKGATTTDGVMKIVKDILFLGFTMGAVMELIPRITKLFIDGLMPISDKTKEVISTRFHGKTIHIGMSPALVIGHPTALVGTLFLIPTYIIIAVLLPRNEFLPLASLAGMFYIFPIMLPYTKGNVVKSYIVGFVVLLIGLWFVTDMAPDFTKAAAAVYAQTQDRAARVPDGFQAGSIDFASNCRSQEHLDKALADYKVKGIDAMGYIADVTDEEQVARLVADIERDLGTIDILVNNAGIIKRIPMLDMSASDFRKVVDIDLNAPFIVSKVVIPGMIKKGHGKIINICSMMSELGRETVSAYAAAKGGLKMLTKNICSEFGGHNIQCNGIGPGYIATPQTAPLRERQPDGSRHPFDQFIVSKTPAGRWGTPEDLMGPAIFLASDASDFVNGHILYVDGGILAYIGKQP